MAERQNAVMVYSPNYSSPLTPVAGSIQVATINQFARKVYEFPAAAFQAWNRTRFAASLASVIQFHVCGRLGNLSDQEHQRSDGRQPVLAFRPIQLRLSWRHGPIAPNENIIQL